MAVTFCFSMFVSNTAMAALMIAVLDTFLARLADDEAGAALRSTLLGLLHAEDVRALPWNVLLLVAGGMCLGLGVLESGLAHWLVAQLDVTGLPAWCVSLALEMGGPDTLLPFAVPVALAASCAMRAAERAGLRHRLRAGPAAPARRHRDRPAGPAARGRLVLRGGPARARRLIPS